MKYGRLTFRVGGALGLLRRCLVVLLSIGCLLHLLSFPAFSHICYESLADTYLFSLYLSEIINIRTANQSQTSTHVSVYINWGGASVRMLSSTYHSKYHHLP